MWNNFIKFVNNKNRDMTIQKLKTGIFVKHYPVDGGAIRVEVLGKLNKQESKWWEKHLEMVKKRKELLGYGS